MINFNYELQPGKKLNNRYESTTITPLVTIVTPYYNSSSKMLQTYNCVMNQTFPWYEWIIVNDGSTEEETKWLNSLSQTDSRIKLFHKENGGIGSARNLGIKKSMTDYIVPLDADDLIDATFLEITYWALQKNPDASWSYTDSVGFEGQEYLWKKSFSSKLMKIENLLVCTAMIRKSDLEAVGCYNDSQKHMNEDWHLWLMLLNQHRFPVHINEYLFWYRRNSTGVLSIVNNNSDIKKASSEIIKKISDTIPDNITAIEFPRKDQRDQFVNAFKYSGNLRLPIKGKKIEVLMLLPWLEMGGADLFNLDIVQRINKEKFHITIITTVSGENLLLQRFKKYTEDIFNLPNFLTRDNYLEFVSYIIETRNIDVIFFSNSYAGYTWMPWIRMTYPQIAIIDCLHMEEWYWRNGGYGRLSKVMEDISDMTLVSNQYLKRILKSQFHCKEEHIQVLYTGVDNQKFSPFRDYGNAVKKAYGISSSDKVVLFVCRLHPQKRPFLMLEIAKRIFASRSDVKFLVVGDGPQRDALEKQANEYNMGAQLIFAGMQEDLRPFYQSSDVMLLCSIKEGISITTFEALSMGLPVVSANVGGQSEVVDDQVGALLPIYQNEKTDFDNRDFKEEEIQQYVNVILHILSNDSLRKKMSIACRNRIEEKYTSQKMIERLEAFLESQIKDKNLSCSRLTQASYLIKFQNVICDYIAAYNEYEIQESMCNEIWDARVYFEKLYQDCQRDLENTNYQLEKITYENKAIKESTIWILGQKIAAFFNKIHIQSFISKIIHKIC